jgi:hypothetical protein
MVGVLLGMDRSHENLSLIHYGGWRADSVIFAHIFQRLSLSKLYESRLEFEES